MPKMSSLSPQMSAAILLLIAFSNSTWAAQVSVASGPQDKIDLIPTTSPSSSVKTSQQQVPSTIMTTSSPTTTTTKPRLSGLLSNMQQSQDDAWSMVSVDKNPSTGVSNKVDVHIPLVFDMSNDKANAKLDLSVLSGMVTVNRDRGRQPNGAASGPLTVSIFGIPIYSGQAASSTAKVPQTQESASSPKVEQVGSSRSDFGVSTRYDTNDKTDPEERASARNIDESLPEPKNPLYENMKKANARLLSHLAESLNKLALYVGHKAEPITHQAGKPADKSDGFVGQSSFLKSDFEPKIVYRNFTLKGDSTAHDSPSHV